MVIVPIGILFLILLLLYGLLLKKYNRRLSSMREYEPQNSSEISVSVVIPARNEENNIDRCLDAIKSQQGLEQDPEIIVVDDHSEDNTANIVSGRNAVLVSLKDEEPESTMAYKKWAITAGIRYAKGKMILTTDADCIPPSEWIRTMSCYLQNENMVMVTGPVRMLPGTSLLSRFQSIDFAILQGITAASVHSGFHDMASGANLGYLKSAFYAVEGFKGIDDIATGDDMLLMQKFSRKFTGQVGYVFSKKAIVDTNPEPDLRSFLRQRIRWASKARRYDDRKIFWILLLVYLLNLCMVAFMVLAFFSPVHFSVCLTAFMLKTIIEWPFVNRILNFFSLAHLMSLFPLIQPLHVLYTVVSGSFGQLGKQRWKGRMVK